MVGGADEEVPNLSEPVGQELASCLSSPMQGVHEHAANLKLDARGRRPDLAAILMNSSSQGRRFRTNDPPFMPAAGG